MEKTCRSFFRAFWPGSKSKSFRHRSARRSPIGSFERPISFEPLERRLLLAVDLGARFEFTDLTHNPVGSLQVGEKFLLRVHVQDLRDTAAQGVLQAYFDVNYDSALTSVVAPAIPTDDPIIHAPGFNVAASGDTSTVGLLDEVGGSDSDDTPPDDPSAELLLFSVPFHADAAGTLSVTGNLADGGSPTLLFDSGPGLLSSEVQFTGGSIDITQPVGPVVSIATTSSGDEAGPTPATLTVSQTTTRTVNTVISYTVGGTATPGNDYTALTGAITIPAGSTTATLSVPVIDDTLVESSETVVVTLGAAIGNDPTVTIGASNSATVNIADNDASQVSVATTNDGNEAGPAAGQFTVTLSRASATDTLIGYTIDSVATNAATSGSDYAALSGSVLIVANQTTAAIDISVIDDTLVELDETVHVTLNTVGSGHPDITIDGTANEATLAILDNDTAELSIANTNDGDESGPTPGNFTITQTATSSVDTVVGYTVGGTATSTSDYTVLAGTVTIPAGATSASIAVPVHDDALIEAVETVVVTLDTITASAPGVTIDTSHQQATVQIVDNDSALASIVAAADGNESGPINGGFTARLAETSQTDTVISYTVSGTAVSPNDYAALGGSVTIPAGALSAPINILVADDSLLEGTENVTITLDAITAGAPGLAIDTLNRVATIDILDDEIPRLSIASGSDVSESSSTAGQFTVSLSTTSSTDTVVSYSIGGTATSGNDYTALTGTVTVPADQLSVPVSVTLLDDNLLEGTETLTITLDTITDGNSQIIIDSQNNAATLNILDDETGLVRIVNSIDGNESGPVNGQFTVSLEGIASTDTDITYTVGGTATAGVDFTSLGGTVTIVAGQISAPIDVPVTDDALLEGTENVTITLGAITSSSPLVAIDPTENQATIDILDDDVAQVSIDTPVHGSEIGPANASLTIRQSATALADTAVNFSISGTATEGSDYSTLSHAATIPAGSTSVVVPLTVLSDTLLEPTETVTITLDSATNGSVSLPIDPTNNSATANILDDDGTALASITAPTPSPASETGPTPGTFQVSLDAISTTDTTIDYTVTGTATAAADYTALGGTVTIAAGTQIATIDVTVLDDTLLEGTETVVVALDAISAGDSRIAIDSAQAQATLDIADDESGLISIAAASDGSEAGPSNGQFLVSQGGVTAIDSVVTYSVLGTATSGADFTPLLGTVTIPAGQTAAALDVAVLPDVLAEGPESVTVTLTGIGSGDASLAIDPGGQTASLQIIDDDTAEVSIAKSLDTSEGGASSGSFTVTQNGVASVDTVLAYTVGGTAASGTDFTALGGTVTIPAGETSASIDVTALDDTTVEATETVTVLLASVTSGAPQVTIDPAQNQAELEIADNDTALLAVAATTQGSEAGSVAGIFTVSLTAPSSINTVVEYTFGGTATSGTDFTPPSGTVTTPSGTVTIGAGQTSATINLPVQDDTVVEGAETVTATLGTITAGHSQISVDSANATDTLQIADNDTAEIAFAKSGSSAIEAVATHALDVKLTVSGGGTLGQDVTVNIVDLQTGSAGTPTDYTLQTTSVTFEAGSADGDTRPVELALTQDDTMEPDETVQLALQLGNTGLNGQVVAGSTDEHAVTITDDPMTGSVSGVVWTDTNLNAQVDDGEMLVPGVTVTLSGQDNQGRTIQIITATDDTGAYQFADLPGGTYDITQTQPIAMHDGSESLGTVNGSAVGQAGEDQFTGVVLPAAASAVDYNFAEWGLRAKYVSTRMLLASTPLRTQIQMLREALALAESLEGDSYQAEAIRNGQVVQTRQIGSEVTFTGTAVVDTFEFIPAGSNQATDASRHTVKTNGITRTFDAALVDQFLFDGAGGSDTLTLHDSDADDVLETDTDTAILSNSDFRVQAIAIELLSAISESGGTDTVQEDATDFVLQLEGPWSTL